MHMITGNAKGVCLKEEFLITSNRHSFSLCQTHRKLITDSLMYCGEDGSYRNENQKNYIQRSAFT